MGVMPTSPIWSGPRRSPHSLMQRPSPMPPGRCSPPSPTSRATGVTAIDAGRARMLLRKHELSCAAERSLAPGRRCQSTRRNPSGRRKQRTPSRSWSPERARCASSRLRPSRSPTDVGGGSRVRRSFLSTQTLAHDTDLSIDTVKKSRRQLRQRRFWTAHLSQGGRGQIAYYRPDPAVLDRKFDEARDPFDLETVDVKGTQIPSEEGINWDGYSSLQE